MLSFDQITHSYLHDGRRLPSVTGILRAVGIYGSYQFSEPHHKFRGSAVHSGCAILDLGGVPRVTAPPHLQHVADEIVNGYWPAFSAFKERTKFQGYCWECPLIIPGQVGGTFDAVGRFGDSPELVILDIKSGVLPEMVPVQLAAYLDLIRRGEPVDPAHPGWEFVQENVRSGVPIKRVALRVEKTGRDTMYASTSKGEPYCAAVWDAVWRSALNVFTLRNNYGLLEAR